MSRLINYPLMSPEDAGSGSPAPIDGKDSEQSIENFLLDDSDDDEEALDLPPKSVKREASAEGDSETPEGDEEETATLEDELEEELADVPSKKLELMEPVRRAAILKEYPDLFKKFPYLEHAYYREQKYTEVFATPDDAVEASEKASALDNFESTLMSGDTSKVFQAIKDSDPNAFNRLVDNLMENLGAVDESAQVHVIRNVGTHLIGLMLNESKVSGNEALKHAAIIFNQFLTGSSQPATQQRLAKDEPKDELSEERRQIAHERFNAVRDDVVTKLDSKINVTLTKRLDPKDSMTEFVRDAAITKAKRELQNVITRDTRFQNIMKQAWARAAKSNYSRADMDYIRQAYESKAANLLPSIINKVRSEALRGAGKRSSNSSESDEQIEIREPQKRGPVASGRSATPNSGSRDARERAKAIPKGMSTRDFLMAD